MTTRAILCDAAPASRCFCAKFPKARSCAQMRQACERNKSGARIGLAQSLARCNLAAVAKFAHTWREPPADNVQTVENLTPWHGLARPKNASVATVCLKCTYAFFLVDASEYSWNTHFPPKPKLSIAQIGENSLPKKPFAQTDFLVFNLTLENIDIRPGFGAASENIAQTRTPPQKTVGFGGGSDPPVSAPLATLARRLRVD